VPLATFSRERVTPATKTFPRERLLGRGGLIRPATLTDAAQLAAVTGFNHPDAQRIRPGWAGERFDLHACIQALFGMRFPNQDQQAA
jgi:hypothetical protein